MATVIDRYAAANGEGAAERPSRRRRARAAFGFPLVEAHLRAGDRRRERPDAGVGLLAGKGHARQPRDRRQRRGGEGGRKAAPERASAKGVKQVGVRSRRLSLSRPGQGVGRRPARGRPRFLSSNERHDRNCRTRTSWNKIMARERHRRDREERDSEFTDKLVHINRVAKVVKGGRGSASPLVVVGDEKGRVGRRLASANWKGYRKATVCRQRGLSAFRCAKAAPSTTMWPVTAPAACIRGRHRPAPGSSPAARCAPCSKPWERRTWVAVSLGSSNPYNMAARDVRRTKHQELALTLRGRAPEY